MIYLCPVCNMAPVMYEKVNCPSCREKILKHLTGETSDMKDSREVKFIGGPKDCTNMVLLGHVTEYVSTEWRKGKSDNGKIAKHHYTLLEVNGEYLISDGKFVMIYMGRVLWD